MNTFTRTITATTAALLASAAVATAAEAPSVGAQHNVTGTAPTALPGSGVKKGEKIPKGDRMFYRAATVAAGDRVKVILTAPKGTKFVTGGYQEGKQFAEVRVDGPGSSYIGTRKMTVTVSGTSKLEGEVTRKIYGYSR